MAYVSQERKAQLAPAIKAVCKKYGIKASIAVRNHLTLALNIKSGNIDFVKNFNEVVGQDLSYRTDSFYRPAKDHISVNPYHYKSHFSGKAKGFLVEVIDAMNNGNHDRSDIQFDYFDVGWYIDVNIGKWGTPYMVTK